MHYICVITTSLIKYKLIYKIEHLNFPTQKVTFTVLFFITINLVLYNHIM